MIKVIKTGSLFNHKLDADFTRATQTAEAKIADQGVALVRSVIQAEAKQRTGRYERAVRSTRIADGTKIHDGGIVYGAWLEGVGSRNSQTSFRGYRQFRDTRTKISGLSKPIVQNEITKILGGN
jgi:hypothetical protein